MTKRASFFREVDVPSLNAIQSCSFWPIALPAMEDHIYSVKTPSSNPDGRWVPRGSHGLSNCQDVAEATLSVKPKIGPWLWPLHEPETRLNLSLCEACMSSIFDAKS